MVATKMKHSLALLLLLSNQLYAQGKTKVKFLLNYLNQNGTEGYQIYDNSNKEELEVFEPMLFVEHQINEKTNINAHFVFDTWSAASDTKLDGNTGASGEGISQQARTSGQIGMSKDYKSWKWSLRAGGSGEYDYKSINFGGSIEGHFAEDNFVISLSPQLFLDKSTDFDIQNEKETPFKSRTIESIDLTMAQILTPSDLLQFNLTYIHMNGMLNNSSSSVKVLSNPYADPFSRYEDVLPNSRNRYALSTKLIHGFSDDMAFALSHRYYTDDWDIKAQTLESSLRLNLFEGTSFAMMSFRYHHQSETKYWAKEFADVEEYMTSSSNMASFDAYRYGIHYSKMFDEGSVFGLKTQERELSTGLYYYERTNGLHYYTLQLGFSALF